MDLKQLETIFDDTAYIRTGGSKEELKRNLDELKRKVEIDLPLLAKDIETVDTESKAKINEIHQMMKEEFAYVINLVSIWLYVFIFILNNYFHIGNKMKNSLEGNTKGNCTYNK